MSLAQAGKARWGDEAKPGDLPVTKPRPAGDGLVSYTQFCILPPEPEDYLF